MAKVTVKRGSLLNQTLFGVGLVIPPWDLELFDIDWFVRGVEGLFAAPEDIREKGDINNDHIINEIDRAILEASFGYTKGEPQYNAAADLNKDGIVDIRDAVILNSNFGLDRRGAKVTQIISNLITSSANTLLTAIPNTVFSAINSLLEADSEAFFKAHPELKQYLPKKETK